MEANNYTKTEKTARYISEIQLEEMTGRSRKSWQRDRSKGGGIRFIRCGGKILYDMKDIEAWMEANKHSSTSGYAGG